MKYWIVLFGLFTTTSITGIAQTVDAHSECISNPPNFIIMSYKEANQSVYVEERKKKCPQYAVNLVSQLKDRKLSNDNKSLLLYFLGEMRPSDADSIELLLDNIDFKATQIDPAIHPVRWGVYPAEEALVKIGMPVSIHVLSRLPSEKDGLRRHLMCEVLSRVGDLSAAVSQLKQKLAAERNAKIRENLELALKELEK